MPPEIQLVYAVGQAGYSFESEARRESIAQHMGGDPFDPKLLLDYLEKNPWDAASIVWTMNLDTMPIYSIRPEGAFGSQAYDRLRLFLREQLTEGVERVSIPGWLVGKTRLLTGQMLPVIQPVIRGMYSWTTQALVRAVCGERPPGSASQKDKEAYSTRADGVGNFLKRVYHELRNAGLTPRDRAINYSATNALLVAKIFEDATREEMSLEVIEAEQSSIFRPGSICWDVRLVFFDPRRTHERARKLYRLTVDVSDVVPVLVGGVHNWFAR